ncbi:MAG: hypothetical protein ACRDOA_00680 [Streptosporangiaceae bacterium]
MVGPDPSRYLLAGIAEGFWQADQADLLADYVPRYFTALGDLARAGLPASLRRLLADQLDDLRRALQVRSAAA